MAQCQNFFDDKSPSICKSSCSSEHQQPSPSSITAEDNGNAAEGHLELRLGMSAGATKLKHHEMVRPIPLYPPLDRQRSGTIAIASAARSSALHRGQSDSFVGQKAFFSKDSAFSTLPLVSRDQVWRSLQSSSAVMASGSARIRSDDSSSSLLCGRSASLQLVVPSNETSESVACSSLRRLCSTSMSAGFLPRQSSFTQEALVDESPDPENSAVNQYQQDALELQKKREIQAHRRLEARKRRRIILEKQQWKAKQCNASNNRQSVSAVEKAFPAGSYSLERKYSIECKPRVEITGADMADGDNKTSSFHSNDVGNSIASSVLHQGSEERLVSHSLVGKVCEYASSGSSDIQGALSNVRQMVASCDLSAGFVATEERSGEQSGAYVETSDVSKVLPSSCSETESTETKEKEMYVSERESSCQKSSTGYNVCHCESAVMASPSSKPMLNIQTSPVASSVDVKLEMKSFQQSSPCLPQTQSANEGLHVSQARCRKFLDHLNEVPSDFTIRKSVGVFSEGKWRIPDEDPTCLPIRRTASTFHEVVPEGHRMAMQLETYASLSTSQLMSAGKSLINPVIPLHSTPQQLGLPSKFHSIEKDVKKTADLGRVGDTFSPRKMAPIKVKEEQDLMDGEITEYCAPANPSRQAPKIEVESIKRQRSASFCELPWVSTTGSGPNGRTINGVMYITGGRSIRLVCRCHGKHMSPAEFVEHAGSTDLSNPLRNIVVNPLPMVVSHLSTPV